MNPYEVLGVPENADADTIKTAYRALAKTAHPDAGGTAEKFREICEAYTILSDPEARARFDATGSADDKGELASILAEIVGCIDVAITSGAADIFGQVIGQWQATLAHWRREYDELFKRRRRLINKVDSVTRADGGRNLFNEVLSSSIEDISAVMVSVQKNIERAKAGVDYLSGYEMRAAEIAPELNRPRKRYDYSNR